MYTDPILEEKKRVQKELCRKCDFDVRRLFENMHKKVFELSGETDAVVKYSNRKGGYMNIGNRDNGVEGFHGRPETEIESVEP